MVKRQRFQKVIVDTIVQEKAAAHPTNSKLLERARQHLVELAAKAGLTPRQNYKSQPNLAVQLGRYAHAKQYRHMRASLKKLKTVAGRVWRDVARQRENISLLVQCFQVAPMPGGYGDINMGAPCARKTCRSIAMGILRSAYASSVASEHRSAPTTF